MKYFTKKGYSYMHFYSLNNYFCKKDYLREIEETQLLTYKLSEDLHNS